jgi:glycosyltransferase involved in cell wall biosynthesis
MKLLYIITNLSTGGAETQLYKIVENLRNNYQIKVISLKSKGDVGDDLVRLGIELDIVRFTKSNFLLSFLKLCISIRKFRPDVVHTWMYHSNLIGGLAAKFSSRNKIIWSIHHNDLTLVHNKLTTIIIAKLGAFFSYLLPERVICVSREVIRNHIAFGYQEKKMFYVPNGIDVNEFSRISNARNLFFKNYNLTEDAILIGFPSRFSPIKNHEGFFRAMSYIKRDDPNLNFQIILSGKNINSENIELITLISKYDLNECVHLMGLVKNMPLFMSAIDLLVNNSYSESFSLVLAEALSCETLCVSTFEGDPEGIIDGIGNYVPAGNSLLLKNAITSFINLNEFEKANNKRMGRDKISMLYSLETVLKSYKLFYINSDKSWAANL